MALAVLSAKDTMSDNNQTQDRYSVETLRTLARYAGPSTRRDRPNDSWVAIVDYRNSDENEQVIAALLSAEGIPFSVDRERRGWKQSGVRMDVTVPPDALPRADALLSAAARASLLDRVEGTRDLI
jgi:hypothetical protein